MEAKIKENIMLTMPEFKEAESYWLEKLSGEVRGGSLPYDYPNWAGEYESCNTVLPFERQLSQKLKDIGEKGELLLYVVMLSALKVLINKYTGQSDIVVCSPAYAKNELGYDSSLIVALRDNISDEMSFGDILKSVRDTVTDGYKNQHYPFSRIAELLEFEENGSFLLKIMLVLESIHDQGNMDEVINELKNDLVFSFNMTEEGIQGSIIYNSKLYGKDTVTMLSERYLHILDNTISNFNLKLTDITLVTEEEKKKIMAVFNNTDISYSKEKTVQRLFEEQVERTPDNIALRYEDMRLTYQELNKKANQLAHTLRGRGIKADTLVGIMAGHTLEMIVGILAVLKAGGAYLPIDAEYPEDRIKYMLEDSKTSIILTHSRMKRVPDFTGDYINMDETEIYGPESANPDNVNTSNDLAYVIYTSGSTGRPKGVMIEHKAVNNFIEGVCQKIEFLPGKTILALTTISFDIFVLESLLPLTRGLEVVIANETQQKDPRQLCKMISENSIEMLQVTPSRMKFIMDADNELDCLKDVKELMIGGEALPRDLFKSLGRLYSQKIYNMYGPTETTVWSTIKDLNGSSKITIGKPIANTKLFILDKSGQLQPVGVAGELCIAGDGLARGYLNRNELTDEKFVPNPFSPGERMYKTGDLVKWLPDGDVEYLGRIDHQVKVRGYRVELGEIESQIIDSGLAKEAVVIAKEDNTGNKYLCAYIVTDREAAVSESRGQLAKELPGYMIPSYFVRLDKIPLTPNGKVDRKALPEPGDNLNSGRGYTAPRSDIESKLAGIWQEVLGVAKVGIYDNFFHLGGHSLNAATVIYRIHREFNVELKFTDIFEKPTVSELAEYINSAEINMYTSIPLAVAKEYYTASSAQKRIFEQSRLDITQTAFNRNGAVIMPKNIDPVRFEKAFEEIIKRHETLRTSFEFVDGQLIQRIHDEVEFAISYLNIDKELGDNPENLLSAEVNKIFDGFVKPFDLSKAPLLRVSHVTTPSERDILIFDMHSIISDQASVSILMTELDVIYNQNKLQPLKLQYKDYSEWQYDLYKKESLKKQEEYWVNKLCGKIPKLNLPGDYLRPAVKSYQGDRCYFEFDYGRTKELRNLAVSNNTTLFTVLLAAYNVLLSKITYQDEMIVGTVIPGRNHEEMEKLIGTFPNTLPIRSLMDHDKTFLQFLGELKENTLEVFENQEYQFEQMVEQLKIQTDSSRHPILDTIFILHNAGLQQAGQPVFTDFQVNNMKSMYDLSMFVEEGFSTILIILEFSTDILKGETVQGFLAGFVNIISQVLEDSEKPLSELGLCSVNDSTTIMEFNDTYDDYDRNRTIHGIFEEQVQKAPDSAALVMGDSILTYSELNNRANKLAVALRNKGVGADCVVAIMTEPSFETIIGILGILKAGGAYLPIDTVLEENEAEYILKDSLAGILLLNRQLKAPLFFTGEVIALDSSEFMKADCLNPEEIHKPENLACVIYTRDYTGLLMGVMIEHRNISAYLNSFCKMTGISGDDITLFKSSCADCVHFEEIFPALSIGGRVVVAGRGCTERPDLLVDLICQNKVSFLSCSPQMINILTNASEQTGSSGPESIRVYINRGEGLTKENIVGIVKSAKIYNAYGSAEVTIGAAYYEMDGSGDAKLFTGKPAANYCAYVFDKNFKLTPVGVAGELYIVGDGIARGYLNQPGLTLEKFVSNPFDSSERMFKTGDIGKWNFDGKFELIAGQGEFKVINTGLRTEISAAELYPVKTVVIPVRVSKSIAGSDDNIYSSITLVEEKEYYPVSSAENRIYILSNMGDTGTSYNITRLRMLEGQVDRRELEESFKVLIKRHETLRTSFEMIGGELMQRVHKEFDFEIDYLEAPEEKLSEIIKEYIKPFDLSKAPLLRSCLVRVSDTRHLLIIDTHHIISDETSCNILMRELVAIRNVQELPQLKIQYKDFSQWQNELLQSDMMAKQKGYWLNRFKGEIPVLNLLTDYPRPLLQSFEGAHLGFSVDKELTEKLNRLAVDNGCTLYMLFLAAFNVLLYKYTGQEDIIIGSPISGRRHADLENVVGMFVNTLVMRNYPRSGIQFIQLLQEVKENAFNAFENQDYQFEAMVEALDITRDLSRNPLFDIMFLMQIAIRTESQNRTRDLTNTGFNFDNKTSKFDLSLYARETLDQIDFSLEYSTRLFKNETISRMAGHFLNILQQLAEYPGMRLSEIEMPLPEEQKEILFGFNDTQAEYPREKTIQQLFEEQAAETPDNIAVVYEDKNLTYQELNQKANQLAGVLRKKGVQAGSIVGIMVERSLEMLVGILGILKAGGAYLPIDPEYPEERIKFMLEDSQAGILLTQSQLKEKYKFDQEMIDLDNEGIYNEGNTNPEIMNHPGDLAYIIYTSGTTGRPKGVMIEHRNVVRLLFNDKTQYDFNQNDIWTMFHSYCFDFSVWEMYGALLYGGKLILIPKITAQDSKEYLMLLKRERVTILNQTPSAFYNLADEEIQSPNRELRIRYVIFGGEALKPGKLKEWNNKYPQTKLINMYGITETTVHVTYKELTEYEISSNISNIGRPIPTLTTYIMDQDMKVQPIGVAGELCVGGDGVGRGYLNQPELTTEKFTQNPYIPSERLYKSGDLARYLSNGEMEYLGRIDQQVKIRGFRIELGEIESRLLKHESIREVVVIVKEDTSGHKYLCAYLVAEQELTVTDLRDYLGKELPEYMIPSYFIQLEKLPLTPNGKIDRKALPEPGGTIQTGVEYVAPTNEIEEKLVEIWQEVLGAEKVGVNDNFFDLGGHSLKAVKIVQLAREQGIKILVADIFTYSSIARILSNTENEIKEEATDDLVVSLSEDQLGHEAETNLFYDGSDIKKELPIKLARNITSYLVRAFTLCVVLSDERMLPWYYQHYVQICSQTDNKGYTLLDYAEPDYLHTDAIVVDGYQGYKGLKDNIISHLIEKINSGCYVIICLDEYYLTNKSSFRKAHFVHETMIYGYDNTTKKFIGVGFTADLVIDKIILDYEEFAKAYETGKRYYKKYAPYAEEYALIYLKSSNTEGKYVFSLEVFLRDLQNYLDSVWDVNRVLLYASINDAETTNYGDVIKFGLNVYEDVIIQLENLLKGTNNIDYRAFHLIAEHKKVMYEKFQYIASCYQITDEIAEMFHQYLGIVEKFEDIRRISLQLSFSRDGLQKQNIDTIKQIINAIKTTKGEEEAILTQIAKKLNCS